MPGVDELSAGADRPRGIGGPPPVANWRTAVRRALRRPWLATSAAAALVAAVGVAVHMSGDRPQPTARPKPAASPPAEPVPSGPVPAPSATAPTVSLAAVGDIIMGSTPALPPNNGRTFFDDVKPHLRGDIVMGNFEGALTDYAKSTKCVAPAPARPTQLPTPPTPTASVPGGTRSTGPKPPAAKASPGGKGCFAFRMPPSYAQWIREAGFNVVTLANNHTRDYGMKGLQDTRKALEARGVQHTGAPGQITTVRVGALNVAVLGFAPYSWTQSVIDIESAVALVERAAKEADLVVVNMHAGGEGADRTHVRPGTEMFLGENRGDPIAFAHAVVDAGADLVVGHSPHVMRGMEWYGGRLIAYSMGNFAGYRVLQSSGPMGIGGILKVTLRADGSWVSGSLVPTHMVRRGLPAPDPDKRALELVNVLSAADLGARACRFAPTGELRPPGPDRTP